MGRAQEPMLRRIAKEVAGEEVAEKLWKRIEIIGDIALIRKPLGFEDLEVFVRIGSKLLERLPYVKSVWLAVSPVNGVYRVRRFIHLAGEPRSETVYREYGCAFKLDITKVYVSPRLGYEHMRIAKMVKDGEVIVNMYAGVGGFSIITAKYANPDIVYSIDLNPYAFKYMVENVRLNSVEDKVIPILGDAYTTCIELLHGEADRVLMPLPELALEHIPAALSCLNREGWIHVYLHVDARTSSDAKKQAIELLIDKLRWFVKSYRVAGSRIVRTVGPCKFQVVVDVYVKKSY